MPSPWQTQMNRVGINFTRQRPDQNWRATSGTPGTQGTNTTALRAPGGNPQPGQGTYAGTNQTGAGWRPQPGGYNIPATQGGSGAEAWRDRNPNNVQSGYTGANLMSGASNPNAQTGGYNPANYPAPPANGATGSSTTQNINGQNMYYGAGEWRLTPGQVHRNRNPVAGAPPPSQPGVIQQGLAEILQPQPSSGYSDPYEAWKAGGRQGARPAGY